MIHHPVLLSILITLTCKTEYILGEATAFHLAQIFEQMGTYLDQFETHTQKLEHVIHYSKSGLAVSNILDNYKNQRQPCNTASPIGILIISENISSLDHNLRKECESGHWKPSQVPTSDSCWRPHVIFLWPDFISSEVEFKSTLSVIYTKQCLNFGHPFQINSQVYFLGIKNSMSEDPPVILEVYTIKMRTIINSIGFDSRNGVGVELNFKKLTRRHNFMGEELRAVAQEDVPEIVRFKEDNGKIEFDGGIDPEYFNAMAASLNLRAAAMIGTGPFNLNSNGTLLGVGRQLVSGEADLTITHWEYLPYRGRFLGFLQPHYTTRITGFFQQPNTTLRRTYIQSVLNLGFGPAGVWTMVLITLLVISAVQRIYVREEFSADHNISNITHWILVALCSQGTSIQPTSTPMRVGVLVAFLFGMLLHAAFSACIISQLSVPNISIKSFDDALKARMTIWKDEATQTINQFLTKLEEDGRSNHIDPRSNSINSEKAGEKILSGATDIYLSIPDEFFIALRALNYSDSCLCGKISTVAVDPIGPPVLSGMMVAKGSPFTEIFNYKQIQMREVGIQNRLLKNYMKTTIPQCPRTTQKLVSTGMEDTLIAFVSLVFAYICSILVLVLEKCVHKCVFNKLTKYMLNEH